MTRNEADEIAVYLSVTYGPWSDGKKAAYSDAFADLDYAITLEAAREYVRTATSKERWPVPGDIRQLAIRTIGRNKELFLTDERQSERPLDHDAGKKKLTAMREALELKLANRSGNADEPRAIGDLIGRPRGVL